MLRGYFSVALLSMVLTVAYPIWAEAQTPACARVFSDREADKAPPVTYTMSESDRSFRDLEPVFKALVSNRAFDLIIPKDYQFQLAIDHAYSVRHSEKDVSYFPYHLDQATNDEARYFHDLLDRFSALLSKFQFLQMTKQTIDWVEWMGSSYRFNASPTTGKSSQFFAKQARVVSLQSTVKKIGRPPFTYIDTSGNWHITNQHFLKFLKNRGIEKVSLYRAQSGFDRYFYRLLLSQGNEESLRRAEFANWLRNQGAYHARPPNENGWWNEIIAKLDDVSQPTDAILLEIAGKSTTSLMFTSITNKYSSHWIGAKKDSEIIQVELNLDQLPEPYLEQIFVGDDLDTEVVFPFTSLEQMAAMRASLRIKP